MPLHYKKIDKNVQGEVQEELKADETTPVGNANKDLELIRLLNESQAPKRKLQVAIVLCVMFGLLAPLGESLSLGWLFLVLPFIAGPFLLLLWISEKEIPPRALLSLQARLETRLFLDCYAPMISKSPS